LIIFMIIGACSKADVEEFTGPDDRELKNLNKSGFPLVDDKITLEFFGGQSALTAEDWNDVLLYNKYEEMTNVHRDWNLVPVDSMTEKRNLILSDGANLPDAFHTASMPASDIMKYGEQGMLLPLNDLIDDYAPNFKKILEDNSDIRKALTFP